MRKIKIYCNICGKKFEDIDLQNGIEIDDDFFCGEPRFKVELDLCANCSRMLIESCAKNPLVESEYYRDDEEDEYGKYDVLLDSEKLDVELFDNYFKDRMRAIYEESE